MQHLTVYLHIKEEYIVAEITNKQKLATVGYVEAILHKLQDWMPFKRKNGGILQDSKDANGEQTLQTTNTNTGEIALGKYNKSDIETLLSIGIGSREERKNAIKLGEGMLDTWEPDNIVNEAIEFYNSFKTTSSLLLEDTRAAVDKLRKLLRDIDLTKEDDKGKPVYTLNTVTAAIKQVPVLVRDLDEAERAIAKELNYSEKIRGSAEKGMYEDL